MNGKKDTHDFTLAFEEEIQRGGPRKALSHVPCKRMNSRHIGEVDQINEEDMHVETRTTKIFRQWFLTFSVAIHCCRVGILEESISFPYNDR